MKNPRSAKPVTNPNGFPNKNTNGNPIVAIVVLSAKANIAVAAVIPSHHGVCCRKYSAPNVSIVVHE